MGNVILKFEPRKNLREFADEKQVMSLLRCVGGRRSSRNMAIMGENLATLAALRAGFGLSRRSVSVDVIYIDPPYNVGGLTGYKNTFRGKSEVERNWAGDHGAFLDFMEPRLKIGRQLLTDEGIMMVSICDAEYARLKILMDEVFGAENSLGTIIWNKNQGSAAKHLAAVHEYVLVYARDANHAPGLLKEKPGAALMVAKAKELKAAGKPYLEAQKEFKQWVSAMEAKGILTTGESPYKLLDPETYRPLRATPSCAQDKPESRSHKKLPHPVTKKACKVPAKGWKWSEETLLSMARHQSHKVGDTFVIAGSIVYGSDETVVPGKLQYLDEKMFQVMPSVLNSSYGGQSDIPSGIEFSTPKPVGFIKELIKSYPKKDCVVLDYFAGSGTTAHAVHALNLEDGGSRAWIMVEEMGSTFENVLVPRLEKTCGEFAKYETEQVAVGTSEIAEFFRNYSKDFLSAYHQYDESTVLNSEGLSILGADRKSSQLVCMAIPSLRKTSTFFMKELALLRAEVMKSKAKSIIIYAVKSQDGSDEPWRGNDKSILSGTSCNRLEVVELPSELVEKWAESLDALVA